MNATAVPSARVISSFAAIIPSLMMTGFLSTVQEAAADPAGLDLTFGTGGTSVLSAAPDDDQSHALAIQPDARIVLAGHAQGAANEEFMIARCLTNGWPDTGFGINGFVVTPVGSGNARAQAVAVQPDGKIVVAGWSRNGATDDFTVLRFFDDGVLDGTFDGDGRVLTGFGAGDDRAQAVAIQSDGKIVVAGFARMGTTRDFAVARYLANGQPDTTFDGDGRATFGTTASEDNAMAVALTGTGRIVLGGYAHDNGSGVDRFVIARLTAGGALDTTFNTTGVVTPAIGTSQDRCHAIAVQSDNKIVAAGYSQSGSQTAIALVRCGTTGALDNTFDGDGIVTTTLGTGSAAANAIAIQSDGKIVVAGNATGTTADIGVVRYLANGALDPGFSGAGRAVVPVGTGSDFGDAVAVQADGRIVAAGSTYHGTAYDTALVRLLGEPVPEIAVEKAGQELTDGDAVSFPDRALNAAPGVVSFTIRNAGSATLQNLAVSVVGSHAGEFTATQPSVTSLAPGATTSFTVSFQPLTEGTRTAAVRIASNDASESPFDLTVRGTGLPPLQLWGNSTLPQAMVGAAYDFTLSATGGTPPYTWALPSAGSMPPGLAVSAAGLITGTPTTAGTHQFTLTLTDSAANQVPVSLQLKVIPAIVGNQLDASFGTGGKVLTPIGAAADSAHAVAVQPDGKIVVGGRADMGAYEHFVLARYQPDGQLDPSFGTGGIVTTAMVVHNSKGRCLALQPDGRILLAGEVDGSGAADFGVARYLANGSPDTSFGTGGRVIVSIADSNDYPKDIFVQSDGKIVVAGAANVDFGVIRLTPAGALDTTFGTGGKVMTDINGNDYAEAGALQADGKIIVAGRGTGTGGVDFILARYLTNGALDTSFGTGGKLSTAVGTADRSDWCLGLAVQPDGKFIAAGYTVTSTQSDDFAAVRYLDNSALDASFGAGGIAITGITQFRDRAMAAAIQPDGAIILAGSGDSGSGDDFGVVRLLPNGTADAGFATNGRLLVPFGTGADIANAVAVQPDGRIIIAGEAHNGLNLDIALVRYTSDLKPRIMVSVPGGGTLTSSGAPLDFGRVALGTSARRTIEITNIGTAPLTGLNATIDFLGMVYFSTSRLATTALAPGATTSLDLTFVPIGEGVRTGSLFIASNDPTAHPFSLALTGMGGTPLQAWRQSYFGSPFNTSPGADSDDGDRDGIVNLLEYAFSGNPTVADPGFAPVMPPAETGLRAISFRCSTSRTDLTYTVQASPTLLPGSWVDVARSTGGGTTVPLGALSTVSDSGSGIRLVTVTPAPSLFPSGKGFLRVKVQY